MAKFKIGYQCKTCGNIEYREAYEPYVEKEQVYLCPNCGAKDHDLYVLATQTVYQDAWYGLRKGK